ncbi:recombinase family protein [Georgenia sp. AZ-5]|uniref:recombinase family protein n=1 Tax=Georgenia sp. AZ-5 TaxID=3367526 RepID=UPI0037543431
MVVWKLDRLGRSTKDVLKIADDLRARGISLRILTGTPAGTYTPMGEGKFFFTMMAAFAEFERDFIRERTRAGLEAPGRRGVPAPTHGHGPHKLAAVRARPREWGKPYADRQGARHLASERLPALGRRPGQPRLGVRAVGVPRGAALTH